MFNYINFLEAETKTSTNVPVFLATGNIVVGSVHVELAIFSEISIEGSVSINLSLIIDMSSSIKVVSIFPDLAVINTGTSELVSIVHVLVAVELSVFASVVNIFSDSVFNRNEAVSSSAFTGSQVGSSLDGLRSRAKDAKEGEENDDKSS